VVMSIADWVSEGDEKDSVRSMEPKMAAAGSVGGPKSLPCMLRPSSVPRLVWDLCSMSFIFYDTVTIPIVLAFSPDDNTFLSVMFWSALVFWSLDIPLNFFTGIYFRGVEELRPLIVWRTYATTWFLPDLAIVAMDWISYLLANSLRGVALARMGKTLRIFRVVRSLRLLRIMKVRHLMEEIQDHITSELVQVLLQMGKLLFLIAISNHFIACLWYAVGVEKDSGGRAGWVEAGQFEDANIAYGYLTSLHWSLTQFTTGSMEISAGTTQERIFSVITLVFSLMVFSSFLSNITASMTQLRQITNVFDHNISTLRRYLKSKDIPHALFMRIMKYVEHQLLSKKQQIQESDVELMHIISLPMRQELMLHIYQPFLLKHPFFKTYGKEDRHAMQRICNSVISVVPLSTGDLLFAQKSSHDQMFFLSIGRLHYEPQKVTMRTGSQDAGNPPPTSRQLSLETGGNQTNPPTSRRSSFSHASVLTAVSPLSPGRLRARIIRSPEENILEVGDWCCEPALWTTWVHLGTMRSQANSEVLTLDSEDFGKVTREHPQTFSRVVKYGRDFVSRLNELTNSGGLSDLAQPQVYRLERLTAQAFSRRSQMHPMGSDTTGNTPSGLPFGGGDEGHQGRSGRALSFAGTEIYDEHVFSSQEGSTGSLHHSAQGHYNIQLSTSGPLSFGGSQNSFQHSQQNQAQQFQIGTGVGSWNSTSVRV